jgi:hypothetical protein
VHKRSATFSFLKEYNLALWYFAVRKKTFI